MLTIEEQWKKLSETNTFCRACGKDVEEARRCYAIPVCYACLPPPEPLKVISAEEMKQMTTGEE
jgi:hypothetical protein